MAIVRRSSTSKLANSIMPLISAIRQIINDGLRLKKKVLMLQPCEMIHKYKM